MKMYQLLIVLMLSALLNTPGFSGADLANMVNEAALLAAVSTMKKSSCTTWKKREIKSSWDRRDDLKSCLTMRLEYHEAGHALVAYLFPREWRFIKQPL